MSIPMNSRLRFLLVPLAALAVAPLAAGTSAADTPVPAEAAPDAAKKKAAERLPFRGTIKSTDAAAMTVTLGGQQRDRVFHITSESRLTKAGQPAVFGDIKPGEEVGGQYRRRENGEMEILSLRVGPRPEPPPPAKKKTSTRPAPPAE